MSCLKRFTDHLPPLSWPSWLPHCSLPTSCSNVHVPNCSNMRDPRTTETYKCTSQKVSLFWSKSKGTIIAYACAWAFVFTWSGVVYGFKGVAKKLAIGLSLGFGIGLLVGGIMYLAHKQDNHVISIAEYVTETFKNPLNPVLVAFITTIIVSMTMNTFPRFPMGVSCIPGFFMGQHLISVSTKLKVDDPQVAPAPGSPNLPVQHSSSGRTVH